jgi:transcriptional regulator with XRE-family HTH domain
LNVIGSQVQRLRERKGWNQGQFAAKLQLWGWDTSQGSVSRLEHGNRRVTDLELLVIAKILGVKLEDLFPRVFRAQIKELAPHYRVKFSRGQVPPSA